MTVDWNENTSALRCSMASGQRLVQILCPRPLARSRNLPSSQGLNAHRCELLAVYGPEPSRAASSRDGCYRGSAPDRPLTTGNRTSALSLSLSFYPPFARPRAQKPKKKETPPSHARMGNRRRFRKIGRQGGRASLPPPRLSDSYVRRAGLGWETLRRLLDLGLLKRP